MRSSRLLDALPKLHAVGGYVLQSVIARRSTSHLPDGRAGWCPAMGERVSQWGEGYFIARKEVARETADAGLEQVLASARRVGERCADSGEFACDAMHGRHRRKAGREAVSNKVVAKFAQFGSARTGRARSDGPHSEVRRAGQWAGASRASARRTT